MGRTTGIFEWAFALSAWSMTAPALPGLTLPPDWILDRIIAAALRRDFPEESK